MRPYLVPLLALLVLTAACGSENAAGTTEETAPVDTVATTTTEQSAVETTRPAEPPTPDTRRIVTLSGDLTEIVFELGFGDSVVATDVTTAYPPEALGLPIVGVGRFLTAEGVLGQSPTLVLGDTQTSPATAIEQIRGAGVPVLIFEVPTTFEGLYAKIRSVGDALGVPERGDELARSLQTQIESALTEATPMEYEPGVAFIYSRGPDVMLLFGSEMTTNPLIEAAGGVDVGAKSGVTKTVAVTPEAVVAAAPDVLIITSEGLEALGGIDGLLAMPGFSETPAGRARMILDYPEGDFLTFGPRIAESLRLLIEDLRRPLGDS